MFLTMVLAFVTIVSSAQFMVVTTIDQPEENAEWEMSNITDNLGIGYQFENGITIGAIKNGEEYDIWGRYQLKMGYLSVQAPTDSIADNLKVGVGYSIKVWDNLYIEPNYSMPLNEDSEGSREGVFKLGVAYRF